MKYVKRIISLLLVLLMTFAVALPALAAKDENGKKIFTLSDAEKVALTSAKSKMILEGVPGEASNEAIITKIKYNKKDDSFSVTVRAQYINKYICTVSVSKILGNEVGFLGSSEFTQQNKVAGFFGQTFEKIGYFFIKLFKMNER